MPIGVLRDFRKELETTREIMRALNYRPVLETDITPGTDMVMVDVQRFIKQGSPETKIGEAGTTAIKLTYTATLIRGAGGRMQVQYTCLDSANSPIIALPLDEFLRDKYTELGVYSNDTRYFVKL